ncbi:sigma 54-interacting transcriptional regulator [Flammeovirgaceae bacterium SG7u.111]|nr:sigma 54-interacting transcriptional regulator [Flammeovirgaceae bacterium SG7u.132]WPO34231.1 sigma 54-interacting transcriptional regulator [Flammeovirgaceae bacterium SG7u.111]
MGAVKGGKILYVDDELENLDSFSLVFFREYDILTASSAREAMGIIEQEAKTSAPIQLLLTDQRMPQITGIQLLEMVSEKYPDIVKILISGYSDLEVVTQAINKVNVYKYVNKPWEKNDLQQTISLALGHYSLKLENKTLLTNLKKVNSELENSNRELTKALEEVEILKNKLQEENVYLREEIELDKNFKEIVTQSYKLKQVLKDVESVSDTDTTVLILGETGTGKELIARAVHHISNRKSHPIVKVNCAALPPQLIESELFGHEKGAFTGANNRKIGRFELANGGTIFLDELGEMPLDVQVKLLRVLQEGEFERVGGTKTIKVDVRLLAATNRDLKVEVEKNNFREDLYYRLNVFPVNLPALRDRSEDIPLLATHFVEKYAVKVGKKIDRIPKKTMEKLVRYSWPGNVRELENIIERAVVVSQNNILEIGDWLDFNTKKKADAKTVVSLEENERRHILQALKAAGGIISGEDGAAAMLKINPSTLRSRMQKLGIKLNKKYDEIS